ncbi:MAG: Glutamate synthase domain 2 [Methanophagales archaeon]|nr:Glutamate synthase domain 2 [Methanophagales archaeon]
MMGNLRRQNANDATGAFNRSRNVAPMSWLCTRFNSCKGDVRSGWHRSEKNH